MLSDSVYGTLTQEGHLAPNSDTLGHRYLFIITEVDTRTIVEISV